MQGKNSAKSSPRAPSFFGVWAKGNKSLYLYGNFAFIRGNDKGRALLVKGITCPFPRGPFDVEEEHSDLTNSSFDLHNGPLWKARLMTSPEGAPCHFPDIKAKFPYQYKLLFSLHHAANDGVVVMLVAELLPCIIDHLLQGLPVDRQQVGELRDGVEARQEEKNIKAAFENDETRLKTALREYEMGKHVPLLIEAFGSPSEVQPSTFVFPALLLDKDVMSRITHKCRCLGITINAFMTAIINTSMVEVVRDSGLKRNNYVITSIHPVDCRRLMGKSLKLYLGYHGLQMTLTMATPHDVKNIFWKYAKTLDSEFRKKLKCNWFCVERVLNVMSRPKGYTHEAYHSQPIPVCYDYMFSNLYSSENLTQGVGKFVQVTSVQNKTVIHKECFPSAYGIFGFRGKVRMEAAHSTVVVHKEVSLRCFEKCLTVIHDVSNATVY
ncbi:hypothetical protein GWK47_022907 [Chionoecetes opilio]|uniref:Condensation domain-containing protein n=1 Tax=Chionoecetes opilio TaxID=41210 RepID=A0A8J5CGW4_CHIOP|nr:hypothetical protein GWK47_022907 [Chionoecetes opilio]